MPSEGKQTNGKQLVAENFRKAIFKTLFCYSLNAKPYIPRVLEYFQLVKLFQVDMLGFSISLFQDILWRPF